MDDKALEKNLLDCGCGKKTVEAFLDCATGGDTERQLAILSRQRRALLSKVHAEEEKINVLDYLVYKLEKEKAMPAGTGKKR